MEEFDEDIDSEDEVDLNILKCPVCEEYTLEVVSRCATCHNCGYSLCSM